MNSLSPIRDPHLQVVFRPEVPEVVVWRFNVVRDLLEHRALSLRFADLAFERSLLTLETALRLRHRELHGTPVSPASPGLQRLYRWAVDSGVVSMNQAFMDAMRSVRNQVAHPTTNPGYGGPGGAVRMTLATVDIVNGMFEDRAVREWRNETHRRLYEHCKELSLGGSILVEGGTVTPLWRVDLLAVENRLPESEVVLAIWPRSVVVEGGPGEIDIDEPRLLRAREVSVRVGNLVVRGENEAVVSPVMGDETHERWAAAVGPIPDALASFETGRLQQEAEDEHRRQIRYHWKAARAASSGVESRGCASSKT